MIRRITVLIISLFTALTGIFAIPSVCAEETMINSSDYIGTEVLSAPCFSEDSITTNAFVSFSELDSLGRAGPALACLGPETLPTVSRKSSVKYNPSGWNNVYYEDVVETGWLYNRCHLIAYCLCGDEGDARNLITGTYELNMEGMLPYERDTVKYIENTGNHVMYRVTPVYYGEDLVPYAVLMEALSVEDGGEGISLSVMLYNVQSGVRIDYSDGSSELI